MTGSTVAARLESVRAQVEQAASAAGRPGQVALVAVTKSVEPPRILEAYRAGQRLFGENRVQEARAKRQVLVQAMPEARWHLVGHLQTNKARPAAAMFDTIESVDSLRVAEALDDGARKAEKWVRILLEVNVAGESSKSGFAPEEVRDSLSALLRLRGLIPSGLMTVAPAAADPASIRWVFRRLRELRDEIAERHDLDRFVELSMGMSGDFQEAIQEGATMVRIGRAIFGERPPWRPGVA